MEFLIESITTGQVTIGPQCKKALSIAIEKGLLSYWEELKKDYIFAYDKIDKK